MTAKDWQDWIALAFLLGFFYVGLYSFFNWLEDALGAEKEQYHDHKD